MSSRSNRRDQPVSNSAILLLDADGRLAGWSTAAQNASGYAPEELRGLAFERLFAADAPGGVAGWLREAAAQRHVAGDGWFTAKDGTRRRTSAFVEKLEADGGADAAFAVSLGDLPASPTESEEQFRLLVQGVTDYAIYLLDPHGNITNWNLGGERIKGYRSDEIIGRHFSLFYTEEEREEGEPQHGLDVAAREGRYEVDGWRVRKDGSRFWAGCVIDAIRDRDGELIGFAKITRDLTEKKRDEETLAATREALAQSQKWKRSAS
jgi:PAS domain S-box-containing protein